MDNHVIVISHRRSGTHLTIDTIKCNFPAFRDNVSLGVIRKRDHKHYVPLATYRKRIEAKPHVILSHVHNNVREYYFDRDEEADFVNQLLENNRIIYVYRDGRDVLTSLYYHTNNDKVATFSEFLRKDSAFDPDRLGRKLTFAEYWNYHVSCWLEHDWLQNDRIMFLKYEDLHNDFPGVVDRLDAFLGERRSRALYNPIRKPGTKNKNPIRNTLFRRLYRVKEFVRYGRLNTAIPRSGKSGDYREHFTPEDLDYFYSIAEETMRKLGYDADPLIVNN